MNDATLVVEYTTPASISSATDDAVPAEQTGELTCFTHGQL